MLYGIGQTDSRLFDAKIEVEGSSLILHSRGGATGGRPARNTEYSNALLAICERAKANGRLTRVLIDSRSARQLPEDRRVLLAGDEILLLSAADLVKTVQQRLLKFGQGSDVRGGNSTKQVRFDFDLPHHSIITSLRLRRTLPNNMLDDGQPVVSRLGVDLLRRVTTLHVRVAVDRLLSGEDASNFSDSRDYDLIVEGGQRLAPKKVFGLALEAALGIDARPGHFSAGWGEPCFELLQAAGYRIVVKDEPAYLIGDGSPATPADAEELAWAEGSAKVVSHLRTERRRNPRASAEKRKQIRSENGGRLRCENAACTTDWYSVFPETIAESVFEIHHTLPVAEMKPNHQTVLSDLRCLCATCHRAEHRRLAIEG